MDELDLGHPSLSLADFHVADAAGKIIGITHLKDCGQALYLSAVGVAPEFRKKGVARMLIETILPPKKKDAYVYTRIPGFFSRLGFSFTDVPTFIPPRGIYDCRECDGRDRCVCMVRRTDASAVS